MKPAVEYLQWIETAKGQRPRTVDARHRQILRWLVWCRCHQVDPMTANHRDILAWLPDVGPDARRVYISALHGLYRYMVLEGYRLDNPADRVPRPLPRRHLPRPISDEDALYVWAKSPDWAKPTLGLAMLCGLRCQELSNARWEDVDWGNRSLLVTGAKGGQERQVVIPDELATVLRSRKRRTGWLARGPEGQGGNPELMSQWVARTLRNELGVEATAHQLRHWYATTMLRRGASVRVVQDALGHASLATTGLYLRVTIQDQAIHAAGLRP
jgi:integrase/recombinase XerD